MDKLQIFALGLLIIRLIALIVLAGVLKRQINYFKTTYTEAPRIRKGLFLLVGITTLTQIIPILVDLAAVLELFPRTNPVQPAGLTYAFNNAITSLVAAFGWRYLYDIIEEDHIKVIKAKKHTEDVEQENADLKADNKK